MTGLHQGAIGGNPYFRVCVFHQCFQLRPTLFAKRGQGPNRPCPHEAIALAQHLLQCGEGCFALFFQAAKTGVADARRRALQIIGSGLVVGSSRFRSRGHNAVNCASPVGVIHLVTSNHRVVPIADINCSVGSHNHVGRSKPHRSIRLPLAPLVIRILHAGGGEKRKSFQPESRPLGDSAITPHDVLTCLAGQQKPSLVSFAESAVLVVGQPGRGAISINVPGWNDARIVLTPVSRPNRLAGSPVHSPAPGSVFRSVPAIAEPHDPRGATTLGVIVVVHPYVAEGVESVTVGIAITMTEHSHPSSVRQNGKENTAAINAAIVALETGCVFLVVRSAPSIPASRPQRPTVSSLDFMRSGVAGVAIPSTVRAHFDLVQGMVVVEPAPSGKKLLLTNDLVLVVFHVHQ